MEEKKKNVIVAMSGGVDSSVSAWLMQQKGYTVTGVFLRLHENYEASEAAARQVCQKLGIKFYPINAISSFQREVIDYFTQSYNKGETPNPCVVCNQAIKFGVLMKMLGTLQAGYLVTGHYVCLRQKLSAQGGPASGWKIKMCRGKDFKKDQSYFLYTLTQEQLKHIKFPLGEYTKNEIYDIAKENELPYFKKESQDICFLIDNGKQIDHNVFLKSKLNLLPGEIRDLDEKVLGRHKGLPLYTVGQRRGIEIGGAGPYYAAKTDYKNNILYVVNDANDKALMRKEFSLRHVNWIRGEVPDLPIKCKVQIRYLHKPLRAQIKNEKLKIKNCLKVVLEKPERAVTPGQSAVFYAKDELIGGGIIN
ncbi:MAG: tRNA 2-thiouridine(34) synthase MnmA [Patescibacteria group bacterium]|nr:tRNA 2-thiouridine(34) synthase MnmA [Patescibacteria group bacterium]